MKNKFYSATKICFLLGMFTFMNHSARACNATFTHTFACAGDTIFFTAVDQAAVYTWDFGDTASGTANISHDTDSYHVYTTPGTYYVTLFVNIGAEWDYRSQIIHVGTDCFNAAFSTSCGGGNIIYFNNESVGNYTSVYWDFGDPASGMSDTSTEVNPYHMYSDSGNYTVTLIISDGTQFDSLIQQINVQQNCLDAQFSNFLGGDCVQNLTSINVYYTGTPISYLWDFGDPASGIANTSTDSIPLHQFSAPGTYLVTLILSDSLQTDTFYSVQNIIDCTVWAGNANRDGQVNMDDLFAIGIFYGNTGASRLGASLNWNSQPCTDWSTGFNGQMYLQDLVDEKNADCNGDGIINSLDVVAISQNYGQHLPNYSRNDRMMPVSVRSFDPLLQLIPGTSTYTAGDTVNVSIDLSNINLGGTYYGLNARIYYDPAFVNPGSMNISFNQCWMGTEGVDLIGLYKNFPLAGYIEFGIVRTNQQSISGNGAVATLQFVLPTNQTGLMGFSLDPAVRLINNGWSANQEIFMPVRVSNSSIQVVVTGINETVNNAFSIYPNPTTNDLHIRMKTNEVVRSWSVSDVLGRIILSDPKVQNGTPELLVNTNSLAKGIYTLRVYTDTNKYSDKFSIVH